MQRLITALTVLACILHVNTFMVKGINNRDNSGESHYNKKAREISNSYGKPHGNDDLESIVLSLNTGIKKILEQHKAADYFDKYAKQIVDVLKGKAEPLFRAGDQKYIKPQQIQLNGEKPSTKIEINANVLSNVLTDILKSDTFKDNFDRIVKQASIIYRNIKDEANNKEN